MSWDRLFCNPLRLALTRIHVYPVRRSAIYGDLAVDTTVDIYHARSTRTVLHLQIASTVARTYNKFYEYTHCTIRYGGDRLS